MQFAWLAEFASAELLVLFETAFVTPYSFSYFHPLTTLCPFCSEIVNYIKVILITAHITKELNQMHFPFLIDDFLDAATFLVSYF